MPLKIDGEVKIESDPCVVAWNGTELFVGTADGSIKTFDAKLSPGSSWTAHAVQAFALAAGGGHVYSASYDGGIRVWSEKGEKIAELPLVPEGGDIGIIHVFEKEVYAGDEKGNVIVYQNNELKAMYNVLEEVKDLWLDPPLLFTSRDLDVTVTEIKPDESKSRFVTRHTMEGRAPLRITGNHLLVMARGGNDLVLKENCIKSGFKTLHAVKASDMIVTSMAVNSDSVWTGGWDKQVRFWKISGDTLQPAGSIDVGTCVNGLVATAPDTAYAIVSGGRIVRLSA